MFDPPPKLVDLDKTVWVHNHKQCHYDPREGLVVHAPQAVEASIRNLRGKYTSSISRGPPQHALSLGLALVSKLLIFLAAVTGPSAASSLVLVSIQAWLLYVLCGATGFYEVRWRTNFIPGIAGNLTSKFWLTLCCIGFLWCSSLPLEAFDSPFILCYQSWLCLQSTPIFSSLCRNYAI